MTPGDQVRRVIDYHAGDKYRARHAAVQKILVPVGPIIEYDAAPRMPHLLWHPKPRSSPQAKVTTVVDGVRAGRFCAFRITHCHVFCAKIELFVVAGGARGVNNMPPMFSILRNNRNIT